MSWLKDCLPRKNQYQTMANALEFILNLIKENTLPVQRSISSSFHLHRISLKEK